MKKEFIRREFFKLKHKGFSYAKCKSILFAQHGYKVNIRTLKRWVKRLDKGDWDLMDSSTRPKTIHRKITPAVEQEVVCLRKQTGWGEDKLFPYLRHLEISKMSIKRILKKQGLCQETKTKGKRVKWVRWQRPRPNDLWQIDHTDEMAEDKCYTLSVVDDATRYSLTLVQLKSVTTKIVTQILDELIKKHGKPKQILTDNGSASA